MGKSAWRHRWAWKTMSSPRPCEMRAPYAICKPSERHWYAIGTPSVRHRYAIGTPSVRHRYAIGTPSAGVESGSRGGRLFVVRTVGDLICFLCYVNKYAKTSFVYPLYVSRRPM